ncbi:MAG TPA: YciI family protein [Acidimicrobiia bacterium]|jgi:hypothetical protein
MGAASFVVMTSQPRRQEHAMRYALLIYTDDASVPSDPESQQQSYADYAEFTKNLTESGRNLGGEALLGVETATTVRVRDGETVTTDGPFAETKETLGGFYLIEAGDLDEAIAVAADLPGSKYGSVEIRPLWEWADES